MNESTDAWLIEVKSILIEISEKMTLLQNSAPNQLMDVEELAKYLKTSESFIRKLYFERKIPAIKVGSCLRFKVSEINKWISELSVNPNINSKN